MTRGVIASGSEETSKAGKYALKLGGNAIDAVISAQLAANVCEPLLTGLGGAGLATVKFNDQHYCLDFFTTMPEWEPYSSDDSMKNVALDFGITKQDFQIGKASVALPTMPNGLYELHKRHGSIPMDMLAKPAINLVKQGFNISRSSEYILRLLQPIYRNSPTMMKWYTNDQGYLKEGMICKCPEMLEDIESFIMTGDRLFLSSKYINSLAETLHNSPNLIKNSFQNYRVDCNSGILNTNKEQGYSILTPGMPSRGAELLNYILNRHPLPPESASNLNSYISTVIQAYSNTENVVSKYYNIQTGFTTHISVVDKDGNAVSLTTSLGESAGFVSNGTGIVLNNFLGEPDVAHPSAISSKGSRLQTMCTPSLLWNELGDVLSIGTGGSGRIPTILSQIIQQYLHRPELTWNERLSKPRIHPVITDQMLEEICYENFGKLSAICTELHKFNKNIKRFDEPNMFFGGVHAAEMRNGIHSGGGDKRRNGYVCILD